MRPNILQFSGFDVHAKKETGVYGTLDWSDISSEINGYEYFTNSQSDTAILGHIGQYMETNTSGVQLQGMPILRPESQWNILRQKLYARFRITDKHGSQDWSTRTFASCQVINSLDHFYGPSIFEAGTTGGHPHPRLIRSDFDGSSSNILPNGPNYPSVSDHPLVIGEWYDLQLYQDRTIGYMK